MQSVNPPDNKACQTSVSNRHLRGNYPPFAEPCAIISRMFWSGPVKRTALDPSWVICSSPQRKQCGQTKEGEHALVHIFPPASSCGNMEQRLWMASLLFISLEISSLLRLWWPIRHSTFCTHATQYGSHWSCMTIGHLTCRWWDRGTILSIIIYCKFNLFKCKWT